MNWIKMGELINDQANNSPQLKQRIRRIEFDFTSTCNQDQNKETVPNKIRTQENEKKVAEDTVKDRESSTKYTYKSTYASSKGREERKNIQKIFSYWSPPAKVI